MSTWGWKWTPCILAWTNSALCSCRLVEGTMTIGSVRSPFLGRVHHPTHPHIFLSNLVSGSSVRRNNLWCFHFVMPLSLYHLYQPAHILCRRFNDFRCLHLFFYYLAGTFLCFMRFQHCFEWLPIGRAMAGSFAAVGANEASVVPQISGCQKSSKYPWDQNCLSVRGRWVGDPSWNFGLMNHVANCCDRNRFKTFPPHLGKLNPYKLPGHLTGGEKLPLTFLRSAEKSCQNQSPWIDFLGPHTNFTPQIVTR